MMQNIDFPSSICYQYNIKEVDMDTVTLSPKFQVVIPRRIRERMNLNPGEKIEVIGYDDRIELVPIRPMSEMRGFLQGLDATFEREEKDRV